MFRWFRKKDYPLRKIALYQALALLGYCGLVGIIFWKGNSWFAAPGYFGPVFVLLLFAVSALICGLIVFSFPFYLFWEKKETKQALRLVGYTALWALLFVFLFILLMLIF
ncbi:MAG: hypothetical protein ABIB61_04280 [Candidatus Shapirobacteria bacterium]